MKRFTMLIAGCLLLTASFAYQWQPWGPSGITATRLCFGVGSGYGIICSSNGMYLYDPVNLSWNFYTYGGLPVLGAAPFSNNSFLVVMGDGTYSDGIYAFDLLTHQFSVVHFCVNPNFITLYPATNTYYVGCQFGGLLTSANGSVWTSSNYFSNKSIVCLEYYDNHLVASEVSNIYGIYYSADSGNTWQQAPAYTPPITDMCFNSQGTLFGIFPDFSNSSGLYRSNDYGASWNLEFYSDNMSSVGIDAVGHIFVGWKSSAAINSGIALYDPLSMPAPGFTFMNNGLASLNINKIQINPMMSSITIFCCTDSGAYYCNDYITPVETVDQTGSKVNVYPNPSYGDIAFSFEPGQVKTVRIEVFDLDGRQVDNKTLRQQDSGSSTYRLNLSGLDAGYYFYRIWLEDRSASGKLLLLSR